MIGGEEVKGTGGESRGSRVRKDKNGGEWEGDGVETSSTCWRDGDGVVPSPTSASPSSPHVCGRRAWDPTALDAFVDGALYAAPDGQIRLKMPGLQEGVNFAERNATAEVFELLPEMDARVETHWVVPEKLGPR